MGSYFLPYLDYFVPTALVCMRFQCLKTEKRQISAKNGLKHVFFPLNFRYFKFSIQKNIQNLIKKILTDLHVREFGLKIQFEAIFFEINVTDEL